MRISDWSSDVCSSDLRKGDLNIRGAYLHMITDAAVSAGVVIAGLVIWQTGLGWIDHVVSLVIAALIFWQPWGLLRESVEMSLAAVPRGTDYEAGRAALGARPGVGATDRTSRQLHPR